MEGYRYRFLKVLDAIPKSPNPIKVLDIGTTPFTILIGETYAHYEISTLDLTNLMEARCKARNIQLKTCTLDDESIPFQDGYFDVVIFTEVLEHIFNQPTEVLKEIRRVMRQQGLLILSVPNIASLFKIKSRSLASQDLKRQSGGYSGVSLLIIDEASQVLDSTYFSVSPMMAVSEGNVSAIGTPHGKVVSYESWINSDEFKKIKITADQIAHNS